MDHETVSKYDWVRAIPFALEKDMRKVLDVIPDRSRDMYSNFVELKLAGEALFIPYRIYVDEPDPSQISSLTAEQQIVLFTLYTRHHNGYVREKYLKKIISHASEYNWITPYLILLIGEYVKEIIEIIHDNRSHLNADTIKDFFHENATYHRTVRNRVASYWDCYYRWACPTKGNYVGFQFLEYLKQLMG